MCKLLNNNNDLKKQRVQIQFCYLNICLTKYIKIRIYMM